VKSTLQRGAVTNPRAAKPANQTNRAAKLYIPPVEKNPHRAGFYFSKSNGKDFLPFDLKM
jgi:hypothetical protein